MSIKRQYQVFIEEMIKGSDQITAYKAAYPKAKDETARVESYRLLQNPTISSAIDKATKERQEAITQANIEAGRNAAILGIEEKNERVIRLQTQIKAIEADLEASIMINYVFIKGEYKKVNQEMNAETKAYLRKTIKDLQAEISKIEGDYAPEKRDHNVAIDTPVIFQLDERFTAD